MADVGDDLLDGDLDETAFGELDGEEEDALLADDDYDNYQNTRQTVYAKSTPQGGNPSQIFHIVDQVQDVSEGDEIIEDGEEDVLELAVVDELDESELENNQVNNQGWAETKPRTLVKDSGARETVVGVTSSTTSLSAVAGESDEEETDGRSTRFKTERTNVISLKGVSSRKSLSEIPDSLDNVKTPVPNAGIRPRGSLQRGGRGSIRGRLGPIQRGGIMRGGFGPMRRPNMMPPPHQHPPPSHKIHINPHFRGGLHQPPSVWDSERLPPPPGCESFAPPSSRHMDGNWGGPPPHHMVRPLFSPHHPGPASFQNPQMYPPQQPPQGYEGQYRPMMDSTQQNPPSRVVQFSESTQLITVENQHFQRPGFVQNFGPTNNQFQPPQNLQPPFNNNIFPNQFNNSPRPRFQTQHFPTPNSSPNFMGCPPHEFQPPPNQMLHQNYENNQNSWNAPPQPIDNQQNQFYPAGQCVQPPTPSVFCDSQQSRPQFRPPFQNQQSSFKPPQQKQFQGAVRGIGLKRPPMRQNLQTLIIPAKKKKFEHIKPKVIPKNTRSNLQEIKTVDNLPDTTVKEPEPEIEEDEETKQYRLKIAEQKALREKILKEKEARRLAAIIEKQKKQESNTNAAVTVVTTPRPQLQETSRERGRIRTNSVKRIPKQQSQGQNLAAPNLAAPVVQIQQMLGTMYKIVKVRTKEGAIVTRKTPLVMNSAGTAATPMRTVNTTGPTQRRVIFNPPQQTQQSSVRTVNNVRGAVRGGMVRGVTNSVRMISATQTQGRTLFTVQTTPSVQAPHRVVIDKRMPNPTMKVATTPVIPISTLVTIDNLSLSTSQSQIQKLAKQVGNLRSFKHEPDLKRATLKFQKPKEAEQFYLKFHRKMIDLSRITVTVVPE